MAVQHVWAKQGDGDPVIGHQIGHANEDGKSPIQMPDGGVAWLDYKAFGIKSDLQGGEFCPV